VLELADTIDQFVCKPEDVQGPTWAEIQGLYDIMYLVCVVNVLLSATRKESRNIHVMSRTVILGYKCLLVQYLVVRGGCLLSIPMLSGPVE
jgi:hypothetical protein